VVLIVASAHDVVARQPKNICVPFGDPVTLTPIEMYEPAGIGAVSAPLSQLKDPSGMVQVTALGLPLTSTENVREPPCTPPGSETARSRATSGVFGESSKMSVQRPTGVLSPLAARH
jgi:hypothetical protein